MFNVHFLCFLTAGKMHLGFHLNFTEAGSLVTVSVENVIILK